MLGVCTGDGQSFVNFLTCADSCPVAWPGRSATITRRVNGGRAATVDLTWPLRVRRDWGMKNKGYRCRSARERSRARSISAW